MTYPLIGAAVAFGVLGVLDIRKHGWQPVNRPHRPTSAALGTWIIDRTYLLYAVAMFIAIGAAILV